MNKLLLATVASAALAFPAFAQSAAQTAQAGQPAAAMSDQEISPSTLNRQQIREIQEALNKNGFDAGHVDGIWGKETRTALENFQRMKSMTASGELDQQALSGLQLNPSQFAEAAPPSPANQAGAANPAAQPAAGLASEVPLRPSESKSAVQAFDSATVSALDVISSPRSKALRVVAIVFRDENGKPVYQTATINKNQLWQATIDAKSGKVMGNPQSIQESQLSRQEQALVKDAQNAKETLVDAVKAAERRENGKAIAAGVQQSNGKFGYVVAVVQNGSAKTFHVDPSSGQVSPA